MSGLGTYPPSRTRHRRRPCAKLFRRISEGRGALVPGLNARRHLRTSLGSFRTGQARNVLATGPCGVSIATNLEYWLSICDKNLRATEHVEPGCGTDVRVC